MFRKQTITVRYNRLHKGIVNRAIQSTGCAVSIIDVAAGVMDVYCENRKDYQVIAARLLQSKAVLEVSGYDKRALKSYPTERARAKVKLTNEQLTATVL